MHIHTQLTSVISNRWIHRPLMYKCDVKPCFWMVHKAHHGVATCCFLSNHNGKQWVCSGVSGASPPYLASGDVGCWSPQTAAWFLAVCTSPWSVDFLYHWSKCKLFVTARVTSVITCVLCGRLYEGQFLDSLKSQYVFGAPVCKSEKAVYSLQTVYIWSQRLNYYLQKAEYEKGRVE